MTKIIEPTAAVLNFGKIKAIFKLIKGLNWCFKLLILGIDYLYDSSWTTLTASNSGI